MKNEAKTKQQLIEELITLQQRNAELEALLKRAALDNKEHRTSNFLQSVLDGIQDKISIIDREMNVLYVNQKINAHYASFKPLVGKKCYTVFKGRTDPCANCSCKVTFSQGKATSEVFHWTDPVGKPAWYEKQSFPLLDEHGNIPAIIVHVRDITERKMAEDKTNTIKQQLHNIIESLPDATFVIDEQKKVIAWNRAIEDMTGIRKDDIMGKGDYVYAVPFYGRPEPILIDHIMNKSICLESRYENVIHKDNLLCAETFHPHKDDGKGIYLWAMASLLYDENENIIGAIESIRDITDRKRMEDDLLKHRHKLEELVIERTRELQETNELLRHEIAGRRKAEKEMARFERLNLIGEMAAGIGHEIRNPMTVVRGLLQILVGKEGFAGYRDYFNIMIDELDRANSIISEFLTLAKTKSVDLTKQSLNSIIEAISPLITADAMASDKYVAIELGAIPDLLLDEKEIRQLILNLTRNGFESMGPGGRLKIRTYSQGDLVVMSIQDHGTGIAEDILEKLGTPFFTTKDNGTGLGLAVCYSIAERHNAAIRVQTGPEGTTFFVEVKIA